MGKGKLAKFADMAEYPHVFEVFCSKSFLSVPVKKCNFVPKTRRTQ